MVKITWQTLEQLSVMLGFVLTGVTHAPGESGHYLTPWSGHNLCPSPAHHQIPEKIGSSIPQQQTLPTTPFCLILEHI